jgi:hypothetical protein
VFATEAKRDSSRKIGAQNDGIILFLEEYSHLRAAKKDCSSAIASPARIPEVTATR